MKPRNILFITPTLQRTGSEIILFQLLNRLDDIHGVSLLSIEKGSLFDSVDSRISKSYVLKKQPGESLINKIVKRIGYALILPAKLFLNRKRTWYVNTIVLTPVLKYARLFGAKCVVHTHELEMMYDLLTEKDRANLLNTPFLVIANSKYSARVFESRQSPAAIEICHPFIDTKKYSFDKERYRNTRTSLSIKDTDFVWLMCGTIDRNKNPELFIELASLFSKIDPSVKFIWVGDNLNDAGYKAQCLETSSGLTNFYWVHANDGSYIDYMNASNGFVLTSLFESFSLVTVEALALGKPVVANNCLGVSEIINSPDIGRIIKEKNKVQDFVAEMKQVMGQQHTFDPLKAIARSREFDIEPAIVRWESILSKYLYL